MLALLGVVLAHSWGAASWLQWLIAIALGLVGVYVSWRLLDWVLIVGTSLFGAALVSISLNNLFDFARGFGILPFLLFFGTGIVYQVRDRKLAAEMKRLRLNLSSESEPQPLAPAEPTATIEPPVDESLPAPVEPVSDLEATIQQDEAVTGK